MIGRLYHIVVVAFVAILASSCTFNPRDFGFEGIASVDDTNPDAIVVELLVRNDSPADVTIKEGGAINVLLKGDKLITLTLDESVEIPPLGRLQIRSTWNVYRHDPATLYAMRRYPIERYLDRITIGYDLHIEGVGRDRHLRHRGFKASKIDIGESTDSHINLENLLR